MNDLLTFRTRENKIKVLNQEISAFRAKDILRSGSRLFTPDGKVASASQVGVVSSDHLLTASLKNQVAALPAEAVPKGSAQKRWSHSQLGDQANEIALATAQEHIDYLVNGLPNFGFTGQVTTSTKHIVYTNSHGSDLQIEYDEYGFHYEFRRKGSPNIADAFFGHSDSVGFAGTQDLRWLVEMLQAYDQEVTVDPGRRKVLMIPEPRTILKIGESLRADSYYEGTALYSGRLGKKIFSDQFSLSDLKYLPERSCLGPFDFEGTLAAGPKLPLLDQGVLTGLISDLRNEKRHNMTSTANGFRDYHNSVRLQFSNLTLERGPRSFRTILKDAGEVIVCGMALGGDLTAQGDFSTPIQLAFLVKNGVVQGRLPPLSMSSHLERMYGTEFLEVASDSIFKQATDPYILCEMDIQVN